VCSSDLKYLVGGRSERANIDVVKEICALMDELHASGRPHCALIEFVADRPGHDKRYAIDCKRLETELGWTASDSFAVGLEKTVRWYLDNPDWWQPLRRTVYNGERLGLIAEDAATAAASAL